MNNLPKLSSVERLVLQMLINSGGELYGLEMVEQSGGKLKKGTVYVTLERMQQKGYIESRVKSDKSSKNNSKRRMYKATGLGQRLFAAYELVSNALDGVYG